MAYIVNRSLSKRGVQVFTGDSSVVNMNKFSLLGNICFRYPSFYKSQDDFLVSLKSFLEQNRICNLIPTHEEIFIISKYIDRLDGINTLVPNFESLKIAHKKDSSSSLAKDIGIPVPSTFYPKTEEDCYAFFNNSPKPIVLKYKNSNSSKGVFYIDSGKQFQDHFRKIGDFVLQEYVRGDGYGVSALYKEGNMRALFTHKRLKEKVVTGGTSTLRMSTRNLELEHYAKLILDRLSWNGVAMVEFKWDEHQKKGYFIEINPRFWGSLALPYYSGMDFPWHYYRIIRDGDIEFVDNYKLGVKVKWLLGGGLGFLDNLIHNKTFSVSALSASADYFDDFSIRDPFVILGEIGYYLAKFFQSMKLNPTKNSSLDIDNI